MCPKSLSFINSVNNHTEPHSLIHESKNPKWIEAMNKEINAIEQNHTWTFTTLPAGKSPIECKWVYFNQVPC